MTKRILTCILALVLAISCFPAREARADMLAGYTSKVDYANTDPTRYKIDIDLTNQVITVYERNDIGEYTNIVLQGLCTTGNEENPTGAGTYQLGHLKERFGYFVAFGQYAQYWTQVIRGIYIHSIMYDSKDITKVSKSAYNGLGKALSHGCVRVLPAHAQWIFYNCPPGTTCVITKRAVDSALVSRLKDAKPSLADARHVEDFKADPPTLAAAVITSAPVRTGFSSTKDSTVVTLNAGDTVKILQLGPDWCKVETGKGKLGYVQTQYLAMDINTLTAAHGSYTASEKTYLYSYPSTSSARLATYDKGTDVQVIGTVDRYWLTARVGDTVGYVRIRHIKAGASGQSTTQVTVNQLSGTAAVRMDLIANLRSGPGSSYGIIGELQPGTVVNVLGAYGSWYSISVNGVEGYVSAVCLQMY